MVSSGASALASRSTSVGGSIKLAARTVRCGDRNDADRPARGDGIFRAVARKLASACDRPRAAGARPRPAQYREFERRDGAAADRAARAAAADACSRASKVTGAIPSSAAAAARRAKMPAGVSASASPPESSAAIFQRASAASTRRPSARSGVTSAAVLPSATASRSATAIASASSSGVGRFDHASASRARLRHAPRKPASAACCRHSSVAAAGRSTSDISRSRPRGPAPSAVDGVAGDADSRQQRLHRELRMSGRRQRSFFSSSPAISRHDASSRSVSRPGSTTAPCGRRAMVAISSAVDGIEPVEPATITGPSVLRASRAASALISASRRATGSISLRSCRMSGHAVRAICRNRSVSCQ